MKKEEKQLEKERLKLERNLKKNGPKNFAKRFIVTQSIIMFVAMKFSDILAETSLGKDVLKYFCIFILGLITVTVFFSVKQCFKLCTKEEYKNIKKWIHLCIGAVAVITFICVSTSYSPKSWVIIEEVPEGFDLDLANRNMQKEEMKYYCIITAIRVAIYVVAAELALFLASKKVSIDSLADSNAKSELKQQEFESQFVKNIFSGNADENVTEETLE